MPAPKGNNYNKKWKTKEERQAAFKAVCEHLADGLSKASFELSDWDTVERYMAEFPEDFPADEIKSAERSGRKKWEQIGMLGTMGEIERFNASSWAFNMKNRFRDDWRDKHEQELSGPNGSALTVNVVKFANDADDTE